MWLLALSLAAATPSGAPESVDALIDALPACQDLECPAARELVTRKATAPLRAALERLQELVRFWAAGLLGELKDVEALLPLVARAGYDAAGAERTPPVEASLRVRSAALYALGQLGDRKATPVLVAALKHKDVNLRIGAVLGLGLLLDPASADALLAALSDRDDEVRGFAAAALGDLREGRAVAGLSLRLSEDVKPAVRALACGALGAIGGDAALTAIAAALEGDAVTDVRLECVRGLAGNASPAARTALEKASAQAAPVGPAAKDALAAPR